MRTVPDLPVPPNWNRIQAAYFARKWSNALAELDEVCPDYPPGHGVHRWRGQALVKLRRFKAARAVLRAYVKASPMDVSGWFWLADAHHELKQFDQAIECIDRAIELAPNACTYSAMKLMYVMDTHNWAEALNVLERAETLCADKGEVFHGERAIILNKLGRHEEALEVSDRDLGTARECPTWWWTRSRIFQSLGRHDEAAQAKAQGDQLAAEP